MDKQLFAGHLQRCSTHIFNTDGNHVPMLFAVMPGEDGGKPIVHHIGMPVMNEEMKVATVEMATSMIRKGANQIAFITEAWTATYDRESYEAYTKGDGPSPSLRDDKKEVMILVHSTQGGDDNYMADIIDDGQGSRTLGPWVKAEEGAVGRFCHLFPKSAANSN